MFEKRSRAMSDNSTQQNANADGVGQFYYNYNGDLRNQDDYDEETIRNDLLSGRVDSSLQPPDMGVIQQEIYRRSRAAMEVCFNLNSKINRTFFSCLRNLFKII